MKYFLYLINIFCLMTYRAGIKDIFDKHLWGADISVKREIIFMDGFQLSGDINLGYLIPFGKKYVFSYKNLKESLMPYWFIGFDFNYSLNNFYSGFLELEKVFFNAGAMADFKNIYAYKFALTVDFNVFFIQFQLLSSSFNIFKNKEIIKYVGIAIGKSCFSSYDSIWTVPISISCFPRKLRKIEFSEDSLVSRHRLNLYKINNHVLDVSQEELNNENHARIVTNFTCLTKNISAGEAKHLDEIKKKCYKIRKALVEIEPFFDQYRMEKEDYKMMINDILLKYREHRSKQQIYTPASSSAFHSKLIDILRLMDDFYKPDVVERKSFFSRRSNRSKKVKNENEVLKIDIDMDSIKAFGLSDEMTDGASMNHAFKEFYKRILFEILIYSNLDERKKFKETRQNKASWTFLA